jgi:hypothetical protein
MFTAAEQQHPTYREPHPHMAYTKQGSFEKPDAQVGIPKQKAHFNTTIL